MASSSAVSRRRLVTSTRLPPAPGSSGRSCSLLAASSSTSSSCRPATRSRHSPVRASRSAGTWPAGTPTVSSRPASASAGLTGSRPGVWPCNGRKICPPGNRPASACAACTANAVLPTPAIPPIAWMLTTPPAAASASAICASSCRRPVNEAMSRGSVLVAATPLARARPGLPRPRAAASNSTRAQPSRPSASTSSRTVSLCGVVARPRSRSLTVRGLTAAASASSSCVSPAPLRSLRSTPPNPAGGSATASPFARDSAVEGNDTPRPGAACGQQPAGREVKADPAQPWRAGLDPAPAPLQIPDRPTAHPRVHRPQFPGCQFRGRSFMFPAAPRCFAETKNISAVNPRWRDHVH